MPETEKSSLYEEIMDELKGIEGVEIVDPDVTSEFTQHCSIGGARCEGPYVVRQIIVKYQTEKRVEKYGWWNLLSRTVDAPITTPSEVEGKLCENAHIEPARDNSDMLTLAYQVSSSTRGELEGYIATERVVITETPLTVDEIKAKVWDRRLV